MFGKRIDNDTLNLISKKARDLMQKYLAGEISRYEGAYILEEYVCGLLCDLSIDK